MAKRKINGPLDEHNETLVEAALRVLNMADPFKKARLGETKATWWLQGTIAEAYNHSIDFVVPNRPVRLSNASSKVKLVLPRLMPMLGKDGSLQSRQAIVHSLVHTDSWAIDSSWGIIARSGKQESMLREFFTDFMKVVCSEGPDRVRELIAIGALFDHGDDGNFHLAREGGHSHQRIVHGADMTGREIERALLKAVVYDPNIFMFEHHFAIDLLTSQDGSETYCHGVDALNTETQEVIRFISKVTLLASGGAGHIYPTTTNPLIQGILYLLASPTHRRANLRQKYLSKLPISEDARESACHSQN